MRKPTIFFTITVSAIISAVVVAVSISAAPQQNSDSSTSQVLINEIRELRRSLQDFATTGQRVQIALERIRIQQDNVDRIQGEIASIDAQSEASASEMQQVEESAKALERLLGMENDPAKRIGLEMERKNALQRLEEGKKREARLRDREAQLNTALTAEKAVLAELKSKVEEIDRSLENQTAPRRK